MRDAHKGAPCTLIIVPESCQKSEDRRGCPWHPRKEEQGRAQVNDERSFAVWTTLLHPKERFSEWSLTSWTGHTTLWSSWTPFAPDPFRRAQALL
mmetsp:Transcript_3817/g.11017  ORF Transcript_3817/g.11017 Transcript_3817/m.11017 type:complete len:95 (+) Transcript_3817:263-547(+)